MNILVINSSKEWGGTEKWALTTAIGLSEKGHNVYFGCRGKGFQEKAASLNKNLNFVTFPFTNNLDILTVIKLKSFFVKHKIDVVMPSMQREYFLAGLAARLSTKAKVAGLYGIDRPIHNFRNWIVFCKLFDIVIVNAKKIVEILSKTKAFDTSKCKIVYNGIESIDCDLNIRKQMRDSLGITDNQICIMGIGRVASQKGFDYAIKALSSLSKTQTNVKLVIVGAGEIEKHKQLASTYGISDKVIFTGFRTDVNNLIQAMDIFWLPSRSEGLPNTMLEAMAVKKPVIVFNIAGISEVIEDNVNGFLIPFEDIELLNKRTAELINNPKLMTLIGERGYQTVKKDYSMERMVSSTEQHLLDLLKK